MAKNVSRRIAAAAGGMRESYHSLRWLGRKRRARARRRRLSEVRYIGVTGSGGKTTTTALIGAILSTAGGCTVSEENTTKGTVWTLRAVSPGDRFCVQELSAAHEGQMSAMLDLFRPHVGVVTAIGTDHYALFRSLDAVAREKSKLIAALPADGGLAVLNADDPRVLGMAGLTRAQVVTYGRAAGADVRATDVACAFPQRLALTVTSSGQSARIDTRLVGEHWVTAVLAAIACCTRFGIDLDTCARTIARFEPLFARVSVHEWRGIHLILDTYKAPLWSLETCMRSIASGSAPRKTIVLGTISDYGGAAGPKYRKIARTALTMADRIVFVGPHAQSVRKMAAADDAGRVFMCQSAHEASRLIAAEPVPGEVIYVKGSIVDHVERLVLTHTDSVVCWRERCGFKGPCTQCDDYRTPSPPPNGVTRSAAG